MTKTTVRSSASKRVWRHFSSTPFIGAEDYLDYDDDFEDNTDKANGVPDVDPYAGVFYPHLQLFIVQHRAGIFFSKDRREEVIEIEEEPEAYTHTGSGNTVKLLAQGQWMKGCPEKGEQNFLFGLYSQFMESEFACPHDCGATIRRNKGDFFALYVSLHLSGFWQLIDLFSRLTSPSFQPTLIAYEVSSVQPARAAIQKCALHVANPCQGRRLEPRVATTPYSIVPTFKALFWVLAF
jgi:hypothetical protein